jgi:hypothetical protein
VDSAQQHSRDLEQWLKIHKKPAIEKKIVGSHYMITRLWHSRSIGRVVIDREMQSNGQGQFPMHRDLAERLLISRDPMVLVYDLRRYEKCCLKPRYMS